MRQIKRFLVVILVIGGLSASALSARADVTSIAGGVTVPTPLGESFQTYQRLVGIDATMWIRQPKVLGSNFQFYINGFYQPLEVSRVDGVFLRQLWFLGGIETRLAAPGAVVPFVGLAAGLNYNWVDFNRGTSDQLNAGGAFGLQFKTGFTLEFTKQLALVIAAPINFAFKNEFAILNGTASLRWSLK